MNSQIVLILLGAALLAGGLGMVYWFRRTLRLGRECQAWPSAKGRIVRSEIRVSNVRDDNEEPSTPTETYSPQVEYDYAVDGQALHASRIQFGGPWGTSLESAQAFTSRYPVGAEVDVYYDPAKPSLATLDRTTSRSSYVGIGIIAALLLGLGVAFLAVGIAGALRPEEPPAAAAEAR